MTTEQKDAAGLDLKAGVAITELADGAMVAGRVGEEFFALGAQCTHYGGPLAEGLIVEDRVRCPWHHACFTLRTGEALEAPPLSPVSCWAVEQRDGKVFVREKREAPAPRPRAAPKADTPGRILIVGVGAAGFAAAAPETRPMGPQLGDFVRGLHEEHGVVFHLEDTAVALEDERVALKSGRVLPADLVVVGVGVRRRLELAEAPGLALDNGLRVDAYLQTSAPGIFAAGDIARWPDPHSGEAIRIEHWVVAERQGQTAARNMLGDHEPFDAVPFFWGQHYDVPINYVGHAAGWDELAVDGDIASKDALVRYKRNGRVLAVASIFRDLDNLRAEVELGRSVA
jgi:NADPH-dependent 2,4-dienoyl-CoA reductase/sulfur reductase-like enzyme